MFIWVPAILGDDKSAIHAAFSTINVLDSNRGILHSTPKLFVPCSGTPKTRMATTLAPVDSREVVRCDDCHLVQFRTNNNLCRRCRTSLDEDEPEPILTTEMAALAEPEEASESEIQVAKAIRNLRHRSGLSQRQLAMRMGVPRTYVSKIENQKAIPTLSSLARLAQALEVSVPDLLRECGPSREDDINELMADPFIAELVEFTSKLNAMQLSSVLAQVRDMVTHPNRGA